MPITTLDPKTALVIVDLQVGITGSIGGAPHAMADVVARNAELVAAFRDKGLPIVFVNVDGAPGGRTDHGGGSPRVLPPETLPIEASLGMLDTDKLVTKRTRGAFHGTDLAQHLADNDVTQVVVTGVATGAGVMATALEAHQHGLNVTLPTDAMTDRDAERHEVTIKHFLSETGETGTTADVLAQLSAR